MSNPWSPAVSNPLSRFEQLLRIQMPGAPQADIDAAIADLLQLAKGETGTSAEVVPPTAQDEVLARISAVESAIEKLKADSAADATVTQRLDAIDRALVALQGSVSKLETRPVAAARAAAPAAKPAATTA